MISSDRPNQRILDRLAIIVGLFGTRGWPEIEVTDDSGRERKMPVSGAVYAKIQYARKVLAEFNRSPISDNSPIPVKVES